MIAECGMRSAECAEATLAIVRELSEHACTRPAPRKLRCIRYVPFCIAPLNRLKEKLEARIHIQMLLIEMSRALRTFGDGGVAGTFCDGASQLP